MLGCQVLRADLQLTSEAQAGPYPGSALQIEPLQAAFESGLLVSPVVVERRCLRRADRIGGYAVLSSDFLHRVDGADVDVVAIDLPGG